MRKYLKNVYVLLASWIIFSFTYSIVDPYIQLYFTELGGSPTLIGIVFSLTPLTASVFYIMGSYIADNYGRRWLVTRISFLIAIVCLGYALSPSWHFLLLFLILEGVAGVYRPALWALYADSLPQHRLASGFLLANVMPRLAAIPSPYIGGRLADLYHIMGYRYGFLMAAIVAFTIAAVRIRYLKETHKVEAKKWSDIPWRRVFKESWREIAYTLRELPKQLMVIFVSAIIFNMSSYMYATYRVIVAVKFMGYTKSVIGSILSCALMVLAIWTLVIVKYRILDRVPKVKAMVAIMFIYSILYLIYTYGELWSILTAFVLSAVFGTTWASLYNSYLMETTPLELRARIQALRMIVRAIATVLGGALASFLYFLYPNYPLIIFYASSVLGFSSISLVLAYWYRKKYKIHPLPQ